MPAVNAQQTPRKGLLIGIPSEARRSVPVNDNIISIILQSLHRICAGGLIFFILNVIYAIII